MFLFTRATAVVALASLWSILEYASAFSLPFTRPFSAPPTAIQRSLVGFAKPKLHDPSTLQDYRCMTRGGALVLWSGSESEIEEVEALKPRLDVGAVGRYVGATLTQAAAIWVVLGGLEALVIRRVPAVAAKAMVFLTFAFLAIKSRVFSVLDNSRPTPAGEKKAKTERRRPSWMPPPKAFPFIWITIAMLRATSTTMVWEALGRSLLSVPTAALVLHLCVGDTWNTINNVEERLGAAVPGVFLVWVTVVNACYQYYRTLPAAGLVLLPSALWITVANFLVQAIWRLNGREPLYPYVTKA